MENHVDFLVDKSGDNPCLAHIFSTNDNTAGPMCNQAGCIRRTNVSKTYEATTSTVIGNDTSG